MEAFLKTFAEQGLIGCMLGFLCYLVWAGHKSLIEILNKFSDVAEKSTAANVENKEAIKENTRILRTIQDKLLEKAG